MSKAHPSRLDLAALFAPLARARSVLLAVSGGSDSVALMALAERWAREGGWTGTLHVATVDHGLRPEAAGEVKFVIQQARNLGLRAHKLKWQGPYPKTGVSATARKARYGLLVALARELEAVIVTAHTQDDQAETLLMHLARGSGVDGLSAMQAHSMRDGVELLRPLLGVSRVQLRDVLKRASISWVEDPTNEDEAYERVRVRAALNELEKLGLTRDAIALSAKRIGRARSALDVAVEGLMRAAVVIEQGCFARVRRAGFVDAPADLQVRLALQLARVFGGGQGLSLSKAEALVQWMVAGAGRARTFGGCRIARRAQCFIIAREAARVSPEPVKISGEVSGPMIWDQRYEVSVPAGLAPAEIVAAAYVSGLERPREVPDFVWRGLPVLRAENALYTPLDSENAGGTQAEHPEFRLIRLR